ncbi:MAG: hypothetical protein KC643_24990 [Nitrospira sp.]|nr:hypothetical protein [Nitrospira sp.]MCA9499796.1 hypothetical protein [Nitrospira sp.]
MRKAFADTLQCVASTDHKLVFVTGDLGFGVFDRFEATFGSRYVNVGVAEAQMIGFAAGMAKEGWHPVTYSIASFATARPFEQIRYCVSYPSLPVTLVGAGRGLTYSTSGISHHALDDIALMTALPHMTVVIPADPIEVEALFPQVRALPGPAYFTVGRFGEPRCEGVEEPVLGRLRLIANGERVAIICAGEILQEVMCARELLLAEGLTPVIFHNHTIKPLDTARLNEVADQVQSILVVEEHLPHGGLWGAMAEWMIQRPSGIPMKRLGPPEAFCFGNLTIEEARNRMGYDAKGIAAACHVLWKS